MFKRKMSKHITGFLIGYQNSIKYASYAKEMKQIIHGILMELVRGDGHIKWCELDMEQSTVTKLLFTVAFAHYDDESSYIGETKHSVSVIPTFVGFNIEVSGKDKNGCKRTIIESFKKFLEREVETITP